MNKLVLVLSFLLVSTCFAEPQNYRGPGNNFNNQKPGGFFQQLNLNPEQKEVLKKTQMQRQELSGKMQELNSERQLLSTMIKDPNIIDSEIRTQLVKVNSLFAEINSARINAILDLRKELSAEQLSMILDKMEQRKEGQKIGTGRFNQGNGGFQQKGRFNNRQNQAE